MSKVRWLFIGIFLLVTIVSNFFETGFINDLMPILSVLSLFIAAFLHGIERYGLKNSVIFLLITWVVSHFFEALSIRVGFPFGHYYYDQVIGPRLFQVPLIIMLGYFSMGYVSWILSNVLLGQYNQKLSGSKIFLIPFVGTFIMVIWDICMDPVSSTVGSLWIWRDGGPYFGVPLQNYFGWFFVVYIIFQIFGIYISRYDAVDSSKSTLFSRRSFWMEASTLYAIQGLSQIITPFTRTDHATIFRSMALISIFTMMFVALISYIIICNNKGISSENSI